LPENDADLNLLIDAAQDAGKIASRHFHGGTRKWDKPDGAGPVTDADLEVDAMLRGRLTRERPGYGWLSEETADTPDRLQAERVFIIDPIDGTRAFADGQTTFAHSLAVVENGQPIAAAVFLPERGLMFTAQKGGGAWLNGEKITATMRDRLDGADILGAKSNFGEQHWRGGALPANQHFRTSLAYRLCLVAQGRFDAMITLRDTWEWDVAAGILIAQEAGATAADMRGALPRFNNPTPLGPGLLVANPALQSALLQRLRPPFSLPA